MGCIFGRNLKLSGVTTRECGRGRDSAGCNGKPESTAVTSGSTLARVAAGTEPVTYGYKDNEKYQIQTRLFYH